MPMWLASLAVLLVFLVVNGEVAASAILWLRASLMARPVITMPPQATHPILPTPRSPLLARNREAKQSGARPCREVLLPRARPVLLVPMAMAKLLSPALL